MLASQWRREGRDVSMTASQSGKTSIGGAASSARRVRTVSSIAETNSKRGALFQEGRHRAYVVSHVRQELAVITKTAK